MKGRRLEGGGTKRRAGLVSQKVEIRGDKWDMVNGDESEMSDASISFMKLLS